MKNPEQFVESVDILVDAFQKGNLEHLSACNCAVGNLISYKTGTYTGSDSWHSPILSIRRTMLDVAPTDSWKAAYKHVREEKIKNIKSDVYYQKGFRKIAKTKYTPEEIEKIEAAFEDIDQNGNYPESNCSYADDEDTKHPATIESMERVIQVLGEIHEIPDETIKCMQSHVKNSTYKFSNILKTPEANKLK